MYDLRLIDGCIGHKEYEMYQDIPRYSVGYENALFGVSYEKYLERMKYYVKNLNESFDDKFECVTKRYIFYVDGVPVGEAGIRMLKNEFYLNNASQIFYVIRESYRGKGLGYVLIVLILNECKRLGFSEIYANCDQENIGSNKLLARHGSVVKTYKRNDDNFSNRYEIKL